MKKLIILLVTILFVIGSSSHTTPKERKKVGLVLSGGGAKGVAHVGALKVIQEAGIPIDYISGTSMGAIVGAMTALGYSPQSLDSIVRSLDWVDLFSDKVARKNMTYNQKLISDKYILSITLNNDNKLNLEGLTSGQNILNLLEKFCIGYTDSISFNSLPIPFSCVAYDMVSGKVIVQNSGDLPLAIRSSMSIPGVFRPVHRDGMVLVDGGIANNYPVDVVRQMGADIVIGVDVGADVMSADQLNNPANLLNQLTTFYGLQKNEDNIKATDLYIRPDINPYTSASFSYNAIDTLITRGENAARNKWVELLELKKTIGIQDSYMPQYLNKHPDFNQLIELGEVKFEGLNYIKPNDVFKISTLQENTKIHEEEIYRGIRKLQGSGLFSKVSYKLSETTPYDLTIILEENTRNSINLGFRFDTKDMAAVLLNATLATKGKHFSEFYLTTRLNENPYVKVAYKIGTPTQRRSSLSYMLKYTTVNIYNDGNKFSNIDYLQNQVDLSFSNITFKDMKITVGLKYDYFDFDALYTNRANDYLEPKSEGLVSLYADAHYDSYDELYYPTRGISIEANYTVTTNGLNIKKQGSPFGALFFKFGTAISASPRVTFLPSVYTRIIHGDNIAFPYRNFIGGSVSGRYFNSHMPFIGFHSLEETENAIIVGQISTRLRLWESQYISLKANYANHTPTAFDFKNSSSLWGAGISYSYNTVVGPVELLVDMSNHYKKPGVYISFGYYF